MPPLKLHLAALVCAAAFRAGAQETPEPPVAPIIHEVSPGVYRIGEIQLDQQTRTVRFPAMLNMQDGTLEYLLVTSEGSTHESLLVSDIAPNDLHFAMLLLGAKGAGLATPAPVDAPPGQIDTKYLKTAPKLEGDRIGISVAWRTDGVETTAPVEDWIFNTATKKPMARGPWIYNGSMFNNGHFLAQLEGAFAALVTYPAALINNPRQGSDNDLIWTVRRNVVPPEKTPLEIIIQLLPNAESKAAP